MFNISVERDEEGIRGVVLPSSGILQGDSRLLVGIPTWRKLRVSHGTYLEKSS